jgi:hypothetical protein
MMDDAASGIGNPAYNQDFEAVSRTSLLPTVLASI